MDAGGYSNVIQTQAELSAPDTGRSLKTAMLQWGAASLRIESNKPKPPPGDWEGEAADAAYARMTTFGNWLTQLSEAWHDLAEAASKIISAHDKAKSAHDPIAKEYTELEARMRELASVTGPHGGVRVQREMEKIRKRMEELQAQSDEVRQEYASGATFAPVRPADPPFKPADGLTSTGSGGAGGGAATNPPAIRRRWPRRWASQWEARSRNQVHSRAAAPGAGHRRAVDRPRAAALGAAARAGRPAAGRPTERRSYPPIRACGPQRVAADRAAGPGAAAEGRRLCRPQ